MSFKGNEGGPISRETAKSWIKNYQVSESAINPEKEITRAHFFGKEKILKLLNEDGCVGIRIYYGKDEKGGQKLLLVGVKKDMDDIAPTHMDRASEDGPMILDLSFPCPPYCPKNSL